MTDLAPTVGLYLDIDHHTLDWCRRYALPAEVRVRYLDQDRTFTFKEFFERLGFEYKENKEEK